MFAWPGYISLAAGTRDNIMSITDIEARCVSKRAETQKAAADLQRMSRLVDVARKDYEDKLPLAEEALSRAETSKRILRLAEDNRNIAAACLIALEDELKSIKEELQVAKDAAVAKAAQELEAANARAEAARAEAAPPVDNTAEHSGEARERTPRPVRRPISQWAISKARSASRFRGGRHIGGTAALRTILRGVEQKQTEGHTFNEPQAITPEQIRAWTPPGMEQRGGTGSSSSSSGTAQVHTPATHEALHREKRREQVFEANRKTLEEEHAAAERNAQEAADRNAFGRARAVRMAPPVAGVPRIRGSASWIWMAPNGIPPPQQAQGTPIPLPAVPASPTTPIPSNRAKAKAKQKNQAKAGALLLVTKAMPKAKPKESADVRP